jgi:hypothetical protein
MMDGFNLDDPLVCEGVIGEGCGGGRIFFVKDTTLFAHDPITQENIELLKDLQGVKSISKSFCVISLELSNKSIEFDLSKMEIV